MPDIQSDTAPAPVNAGQAHTHTLTDEQVALNFACSYLANVVDPNLRGTVPFVIDRLMAISTALNKGELRHYFVRGRNAARARTTLARGRSKAAARVAPRAPKRGD